MIYVRIQADDSEQSVELYAEGHAGYALLGEDIVCAAVSILCFSVEAYILCQPSERFGEVTTERGDGFSRVSVTAKDWGDYERLIEAVTSTRLALMRLTHDFPGRIRFEDITL